MTDTATVDRAVRPLIDRVLARRPDADVALIDRAYVVARDAHRDQMRRSGDPYIAHPLGVAMILADLGLDDVTLAGALLHDAVEDTELTLVDLVEQFGEDVGAIVDGVTKLDRLEFEQQVPAPSDVRGQGRRDVDQTNDRGGDRGERRHAPCEAL